MNTIQKFDTIHQHNELLGQETLHPLVNIIRNVAIENAQINIKRTDSVRIYAGIVAGVMDKSETGAGALITNCAVSGTVSILSVFTRYF